MAAELVFLHCPHCERECAAEVPPCVDGHGERCPDRACVECGTALWWDVPLVQVGRRRSAPARPASAPRHAA